MRPQIYGLNLLRAIAIIMVMLDHGMIDKFAGLGNAAFHCVVSCNAVLFLMISGALLLPVEGSWSRFELKRFKRVAFPYLFWMTVLILISWALGRYTTSWAVFMLKYEWLTPFTGPGWFVFIILSLYLFMPIISPWLKCATRRQLEYFMFFWLCGGLCIWLEKWMGLSINANIFVSFIDYMGYCVAGYYLMRYPINAPAEPLPSTPASTEKGFAATVSRLFNSVLATVDRHRRLLIISLGIIIGFIFPLYTLWSKGFKPDIADIVDSNFSINTYLWGALLFALLMPVKSLGKVGNFIVGIYSRNAFGIYLIHTPVDILAAYFFPEVMQSILWATVINLTIPLLISEATRRIPWIGSGGA